MPGGSSKPYRMPCITQTAFFLGSAFQHGVAPELVDKYVNTTVVENWDSEVGGTIPPYERWTQDLSGGDSCEVHHCVPDGAPCAAWPVPYTANTFSHTPGDQVDFAVARKTGFKNVQAKRLWHGMFDFSAGEKGCALTLCEDGSMYQPYQETPTQTKYLTLRRSVTMHWTIAFFGPIPGSTDDQGNVCGCGPFSGDGEASLTFEHTIDPLTGEIKLTSASFTYTPMDGGDIGSGYNLNSCLDLLAHASDCAAQFQVFLNDNAAYIASQSSNPNFTGSSSGSASATSLTAEYSAYIKNTMGGSLGCDAEDVQVGVDYSLEITLSGENTVRSIYSDIKDLLALWPLNDDKLYPWRTDLKVGLAPTVSRNEKGPSTPLEGAMPIYGGFSNGASPSTIQVGTVDDLRSPITDRNGNAPFTTVNPSPPAGWTYSPSNNGSAIDDVNGSAPYTKAGEPLNSIRRRCGTPVDWIPTYDTTPVDWIPTYDQMTWFDPAVYEWVFAPGTDSSNAAATDLKKLYDGSVLGAPLAAGYQNYFDFGFLDVRGCCYEPPDNPGAHVWTWYQIGWGMDVSTFNTLSSSQLPLNATQWNNWFQAVNKPAGAWIFYADKADYFPGNCPPASEELHAGAGDAGAIVAQKWAEILEPWNSQNFARPAGDDKFLWDETRVLCATNVSGTGTGSVWALTDPATGLAPSTTPEVDDYWGGPSVGGFYLLAGWDGTNVTLGAKQYDVPSNFASRSNGDDATAFGPLRWADKPSLLGRVGITPDGAGTTFTFANAQPAFGMNSSTHQESVDLYDASMTLLAGSVTATRIDDTHFSIAAAQHSAAFAMIHGAPAYYFNDDLRKGDFLLLQWESDFRSPGEYGRLAGVTDCSGSIPDRPSANAGGGPVDLPYKSFSQTADCLGFSPCSPQVVCITPNGEAFPNGKTYAFPETFQADETYGSKWWGYIQSTMTDLLWQPPHRPCNIESCAHWKQDDGSCQEDTGGSCPDDPPTYFFEDYPLVEARASVPSNYGNGQDETTALADGLQIGWLSPVTHTSADGAVAFPPEPSGPADDGVPGNVVMPWYLHALYCESSAGSCRFDYSVPGC